MSKRAGNVVGPDDVRRALRRGRRAGCTSSSSGRPTRTWSGRRRASRAMARFVRRLWRVVARGRGERAGGRAGRTAPLARKAHATIAKVTDDIGRRFAFNTAIAAVMELVNELSRDRPARTARFAAETAVSLIQPYAPHVAEELWERLGHERLWEEPWPVADPALLERETVEVVVQVNGKVRDRLQVPASTRPRTSSSRWRARPSACRRTWTAASPRDDRRPGQARQLRRLAARMPAQQLACGGVHPSVTGRRGTLGDMPLPARLALDGARARSGRARAAGRGRAHAGRRGRCALRAAVRAARAEPAAARAEGSSSTSWARCGGRVSTGCATARASPTRSPAPAARPRGRSRRAQPRGAARRRDAGARAASRSRRASRRTAATARQRRVRPVEPLAATVEQLDALPGVGPVTAQKILDYRTEHGPFRSVDDLDAVPGIGPARIEQLRDLVTP